MAEKYFDEKINKHTDWGGDESTQGKQVKGSRVQEFIKEQLENKVGYFYYDVSNNRHLAFADEETKDRYLEDTTLTDLILGTFDAPFNYNAIISLETPLYNVLPLGTIDNYLDFSFRVENKGGSPTGESVICTYTFRKGSSVQRVSENYTAGKNVHFNIDKYLSEGLNQITIAIQGVDSLAATTIGLTFQVIDLHLSCETDLAQVFNLSAEEKTLTAEYILRGFGSKILEWYIDGEQLEFVKSEDEILDAEVTRAKYITLSNLSEGTHSLQVRAYTFVEGERFYSQTIYREFIVDNGNNTAPFFVAFATDIPNEYGVVSDRKIYGMQQYMAFPLDFAVYSRRSNESIVDIYLGDSLQSSIVSENGIANRISLISSISGDTTIKFGVNEDEISIPTEITPSSINIQEITSNLQLDFRALGKSNNASDKDSWSNNGYSGTFTGFNWSNSSGWVDNSLLINAGASFAIDLAPLAGNPTSLGKTIEIEFSTLNVNDDNAIICDLRDSSGAGLLITATQVKLISQSGVTIESSFKDGETIRFAFVINKAQNATNKCMSFLGVNGIISRGTGWSPTDRYTSSKTLLFEGSEGAEVKLKAIRIYDTALSYDQILNNYILYRDTAQEMVEVYERNDVYTEGSLDLDPDKMNGRLPVMIVTGNIPVLENTTNKNEQIIVDIEYKNLQDTSRNFTMESAAMRPQGTSSMGYPKKNFRIYTQKNENTILRDSEGKVVPNKLYSFKKKSQPVNCWCLKADYAESSGTHNTGIARLWNDALYNAKVNGENVLRTEAQKAALLADYEYDVRTAIDGFPILLFYRLTKNDPLIFIGKYNFNNDKSTESVFGFKDVPGFDNSRMQCWEILNNGNPLALFTSVSGFDSTWDEAFESRYPDTSNPNTTDLKAFCTWMTNVDASNFSTQKWAHFDIPKVAAYYVYLMRFGAVDQLVKNAMLTSEDGEHFYFINYDNDTINGLINTGHLAAPWDTLRDTIGSDGEPYYAGRDSRLWNMLENDTEFMEIVKQVDDSLYQAGLRYEDVINMFDNEQAGKWVERVYNQDAQYKYIGPYAESGTDNLFMLQGNRSQHRKYWLARRFSYFDSKFVSGAYKSNSVEIKCLNNTQAGQQFTITAGTAMDYGYGINNVPRSSNIALEENDTHTFETTEAINLGDPIRIYAAPNLKGIDLSAMADRLATISIGGVYNSSLGTRLKELIIGNVSLENTEVSSISGLPLAEKLERIDVRNMKGLTSLDLSNQKNILYVDTTGSNVANIQFASGASLQTLKISTAMQNLVLEDLPNLSTLTSENNFATLRTINVRNVPRITQNFSFVYDWMQGTQLGASNLELEMSGIRWQNIDPEQLLALGNIGLINLRGKVYVTTVTQEQVGQLSEVFGADCFEKSGDFQIVAPDGVFISGDSAFRGDETLRLSAAVFSDNVGRVEWRIASGSNATVTASQDSFSCVVSATESTSNRAIVVEAKHIPTAGTVATVTKTITVKAVVRVTSSSTIGGPETIGGSGEFVFNPAPTNYNAPYTVTWSLSGDAFTAGNVEIKSQNNQSCQVRVTDKVQGQTFTVNALVNNGKTTFTKTKSVSVGTKMTLYLTSNQPDDEATFENVKASVSVGNKNYQVGNGGDVQCASGSVIIISFPEVTDYKTPDTIEFVIGDNDEEKIGTYLTERVEVSLSANDGYNLIGAVVKIRDIDYTWGGIPISVKIPFGRSYNIALPYTSSHISYNTTQTLVASQATRVVNGIYETIPDNMIIIDQNISDPETMISGNVNNNVIQQIRTNSHRYLGKCTADGEMTLCQLDDSDSNYYTDGTPAVLTGEDGSVFMKMPDFWYRSGTVGAAAWGLQFSYGSSSPGDGWDKWDTNALIGAFKLSKENQKYRSVKEGGLANVYSIYEIGNGFQLVDWQMHCVMAILFFAQYGHTNSQLKIGSGRNLSGAYYQYKAGTTSTLGMSDTKGSSPVVGLNDNGVSGDAADINFWGLEDWWGGAREALFNITPSIMGGDAFCDVTDVINGNRTIRRTTYSGTIQKMYFGEHCDLTPTNTVSGSNLYFCDTGWGDSKSRICRSCEGNSSNTGICSLGIGADYSRLAFRGNCIIEEDPEVFKSLTEID